MQAFEQRAVVTGILLLLAAISGVVTSSMGRPLNVPVSTAHKLLAISAVVFAVLLVIDVQKAVGLGAPLVALIILTGLLLLGVFATGALLSFEKLVSVPLRAVHAATPFLAMAGVVVLAYMRVR
jgi:hypothetical protein